MEHFIFDLSMVLFGSAILSYLAVISRQPIVIAYILCGVLLGPWGFGWVKHIEFIETISHLGITLLLFLAGLCLHPQKFAHLLRKTSLITLTICFLSFLLAFLFGLICRFNLFDSVCIGLALMFSSTILAVKLLPTTELHQKRIGAICISVLIMEDLIAIAVLAFIRGLDASPGGIIDFLFLIIKLSVFIGLLALFEHYILRTILKRVEHLHEMIFILGLAWCFGVASISNSMGLFYETGAFIAGVIMARHPIALFISGNLKPLRDFFLVLFFFTLGAKLDLFVMKIILLPSIILAAIFMFFKPLAFKHLFIWAGETAPFSKEIGVRLGQLSEFSLLIALLALELNHISHEAAQLIQLTTILTFIASSYMVVFQYPTPIGTSKKLTRD